MTNATSTRPFEVGDRVKHVKYGLGTIIKIDPEDLIVAYLVCFDDTKSTWWSIESTLTHADSEAVEPAYKYGQEVEATNHDEWPELPYRGRYGFPDPDGINHWITLASFSMTLFKHVRSISKPADPREAMKAEIKRHIGVLGGACSLCWEPRPTGEFDSTQASKFVDDVFASVMESINVYLAAMKAKWEAEVQKIMPTVDDFIDNTNHINDMNVFLLWCDTPEGQAWLRERRKEGKK